MPTHNLLLLARISELAERVEVPVLIGTSRKAFIGALLAGNVLDGTAQFFGDSGRAFRAVGRDQVGQGLPSWRASVLKAR